MMDLSYENLFKIRGSVVALKRVNPYTGTKEVDLVEIIDVYQDEILAKSYGSHASQGTNKQTMLEVERIPSRLPKIDKFSYLPDTYCVPVQNVLSLRVLDDNEIELARILYAETT